MERRKTFVLWVSPNPQAAVLEGRLEEVDTGREMRFRSAEQLITCLAECLRSTPGEVDASLMALK